MVHGASVRALSKYMSYIYVLVHKLLTSKYSGPRSSLPKIATSEPPRAEKLVFFRQNIGMFERLCTQSYISFSSDSFE